MWTQLIFNWAALEEAQAKRRFLAQELELPFPVDPELRNLELKPKERDFKEILPPPFTFGV